MKLNQILTNPTKDWLYPIVIITISLLVYSAVLIIGLPREISWTARYGWTTVLIAIVLLLYPAYRLSGWIGTLTSLSSTLILFALPLSALWSSGITDSSIIGGLMPWSDASDYYWDARRLLEGGTFSAYSSRRPLFAGLLASLLGLTGQNLQAALAILVVINAISCFLLVREVQRSHGTTAGLIVLAILFLFYRRFIGTTLTENLGLALGAVGLAILWRGGLNKHINLCLLGLFILTLALNARAGALFILPALILWGTWAFRGSSRFSMRFLLSGASVVLLGFILNSFLLKIVGSPESGFSNFSYVLYGLLVGGDWTRVLTDHPELKTVSEPELSQRIYALAFEVLRANPLSIVTGSFRAWNQFLFADYIFSFITKIKLNFFLQFLSVIALFSCFRQRSEPYASLVIAATLGILASVPFAPPWDADGMRVYAATIPLIALLPALGIEYLVNPMQLQQLPKASNLVNSSQFLLVFSTILAVFIFFAPITIKLLSRSPQIPNISCPDGTDAVYVRISPGSSINIVADDSLRQTHLPNVRVSDFRTGLAGFPYPEIAKELMPLNPATKIMNTLNLKDWRHMWLIVESTKIPQGSDIVSICGKISTNPISQPYGFFYAGSIQGASVISNK